MPTRLSIVMAFLILIQIDSFAQPFQLRNLFVPGQTAQAKTTVHMQGDSMIGEDNAATNLTMEMYRDFRVNTADPKTGANIDINVTRILTKGGMNKTTFDQDLTGEELQHTMFGVTQMNVDVTPLGRVSGGEHFDISKLGITLPDSGMSSGGFEVPTFPFDPVQVGDSWSEEGTILNLQSRSQTVKSGEKVYQLQRIYPTANGRVGVIHYWKKSNLSGLNLGNTSLGTDALKASPGLQNIKGPQTIQNLQVPDLTIELEGEIHFNIDRGAVFKTVQQGKWNLNMDIPISTEPKQKSTSLEQKGMDIKIQTEFLWKLPQQSQKNLPAAGQQQQPKIELAQPEMP